MTYFSQLETIADTITFHAARIPDHTAVICQDDSVTYRELDLSSNRTANGIASLNLQPGARVAYLGKESIFYYDILFACAKSGTVLVPINWRLSAGEVDHILRDSGTALLFVDQEFLSSVNQLRHYLPDLKQIVVVDEGEGLKGGFNAWQSAFSDQEQVLQISAETPIAQLYTSGTTGLPKGVVLPHRSFFKIRKELAEHGLKWIDWHQDDVSLIGIPGFHVGGLWWAMQGFNAGITNVTLKAFVAHDAVQIIEQLGVSIACVVPAMIQMMLNDRSVDKRSFSRLRKLVYGGSPISESLLEQGLRTMQCDFAQIYGLTETGNTAVCLPPEAHQVGSPRMLAAGRPYPGVVLKIVDKNGVSLPAAKVGEVCIRTPAHMLEYWRNPAATQETLIDGWVYTGDAGYLDEEGYLYICDRIKDVVIVAGENVYPAEIENVLCKHPAVLDVAVIGVPDERWGEALQAFIALREGQSVKARELLLFLKGKIADYKIPGRYEFVESIARNPSGKILRRELRDKYWTHLQRKVN
ncbi:MAG: long-chain-fatty-acid--CoA ligase [Candidatus Thiodiazotropha endolucinida]|uniref:Long-chain-fatty-acid--CoA ligase n=1 Tax=Candidatus Thiodiazotropha taylori TaxID=2792791 RepID=A0A9E4NK91_9GAMM|nr:long-chain-fatty-acid--CoA ligase [Candidatus Thiodiazotropha taylori]MCW4236475.1 long-chain-fatty-acid--CoA ligase [Candidatus Thiodiazotropha endolucinida]